MTQKIGILHRAVRKAMRYAGRIVYVIRHTLGKLHYVLAIRHHGKVLARCFWSPESGLRTIVRG